MKARVRQKAPAQSIDFVDVDQPGMYVLKTDDSVAEGTSFLGCYVKVAPTVRSSERATLDTKAIRERLLAAGATAVVVVPTVIPDAVVPKRKEAPQRSSAEEHLRAWFSSTKGIGADVVKEALAEAMTSIGEAGL